MGELLSFLAVAVVVIVTPGPDTAVTVRSALAGGARGGIRTAAGVATGQLCWTLAASAGVTAILLASEPIFLALKWAGAAYLVLLGAQALLAAIRGFEPDAPGRQDAGGAGRAFRLGLISDLSSPKMAAFFTSLLPQFAGPEPSFAAMAALGAIFCVLTFAWLTLYAITIDRAARVLLRPLVRRCMEALTGFALVALGARVALQSRTP